MSQVLIPPTVGRVVWFYPSLLTGEAGFAPPSEGKPLAAIVAHVWNDHMVNLAVLDANGASHPRTSVPMIHEGEPAPTGGFFCEWMPFQKGQAKVQTAAAASTGDAATEQLIVAKGKTAPRVTPADIAANIASEHYFTAHDGVVGIRVAPLTGGDAMAEAAQLPVAQALGLLTFCVLVLRNGFTVTGESACASPENFDAEIGRKIARENAVQKIWALMGYALKQRLHDEAIS